MGFERGGSRMAIVDRCQLTIVSGNSHDILAQRWIGCGYQNTADITSW